MITVIIMMHVHDDDVDDPGDVEGFNPDNVDVHDSDGVDDHDDCDDDDGDGDDDGDDDDHVMVT